MEKINWGIIGCGDVTEVKSGPAFNKVPGSSLIAVMRRDAEKAADYAKRHNVPKWYAAANDLINDPEINAIYIATPPASHEAYALQAIAAGKPVYVEKPMAVNYAAAQNMAAEATAKNVKLCTAHYRRQQPLFIKIKQLLDEKVIGDVCHERFPACSSFKVPLAVMAFDSGALNDEKQVLKWDGEKRFLEAWNKDQDARSWMRESVVWFSQRLRPKLGEKKFKEYLRHIASISLVSSDGAELFGKSLGGMPKPQSLQISSLAGIIKTIAGRCFSRRRTDNCLINRSSNAIFN